MPVAHSIRIATLAAGVWSYDAFDGVQTFTPITGAWPAGFRPATILATINIVSTSGPVVAVITVKDIAAVTIGSFSGSVPIGASEYTIALSFAALDIGTIKFDINDGVVVAPTSIVAIFRPITPPFWKDTVNVDSSYS
jgi:hypothetical protein